MCFKKCSLIKLNLKFSTFLLSINLMFSTFKTVEVLPAKEHKCFHDNTLHLLILAITCLLRYRRRHNVTALFANMIFSLECKILIKNSYQLEGYNARQLRSEFPDKGWTTSRINRLFKKFRDMGTVDRRQGSDRPRSARTDANNDKVNDMVLSQKDKPRTHSTVREISWKTGIPKSFVVRFIFSWNALRGDVRKSWLRRTALLVIYFWRNFPSLQQTSSSLQMKRCPLWLQQWENCENWIRCLLRAQCNFHQIWIANFPT